MKINIRKCTTGARGKHSPQVLAASIRHRCWQQAFATGAGDEHSPQVLAASIRAVAPEGLQNYARGKRGVFRITRGAPRGPSESRAASPDVLPNYAR